MNFKKMAVGQGISKLLLFVVCLFVSISVTAAQTVRYQHSDMLGTPVMETDESGNVINRSIYEPFGKRLGGDKEGIGYTGHLQDKDLGLTYMQARYYDPLIGRFYSNDPVGFRDIHSFNRYVYANNNPYKYTDPTGKVPEFISARQMARNIGGAQGVATFDQAANDVGMEASGANDLINATTSLANGDISGAALSVAMAVIKPAKGLKVLKKSQLKIKGIDAEAFKESEVGSKQAAKFNMAADKDGNVSLTPVKKGAVEPIPTNQKLDEIAQDFPLEKKT